MVGTAVFARLTWRHTEHLAHRPSPAVIERYTGLGEMNPDQRWQSTLDLEARTLLQVRISHADDAEEVFSTLMGDTVETRREFIETNALNVENFGV